MFLEPRSIFTKYKITVTPKIKTTLVYGVTVVLYFVRPLCFRVIYVTVLKKLQLDKFIFMKMNN